MMLSEHSKKGFILVVTGLLQYAACLKLNANITTETPALQTSDTTADDYCAVEGMSLTMTCTYELEGTETVSYLRWIAVADDDRDRSIYSSNGVNAGAIQPVLHGRASASFIGSAPVTNVLVIQNFSSDVDVKNYICKVGLWSGDVPEAPVSLTTTTIDTTQLTSRSYGLKHDYTDGKKSVDIKVTPPTIGDVEYPNPVPVATAGSEKLICKPVSATECTLNVSGVKTGVTVKVRVKIGPIDYSSSGEFEIEEPSISVIIIVAVIVVATVAAVVIFIAIYCIIKKYKKDGKLPRPFGQREANNQPSRAGGENVPLSKTDPVM